MFGRFNKTPYKVGNTEVEGNSDYLLPTPTAKVEHEPAYEEAYYTIGLTPDGRSEITFGQRGKLHQTLSMNDAAVAHMIRLLAVNIADNFTVTVTPVVQDNQSEETT